MSMYSTNMAIKHRKIKILDQDNQSHNQHVKYPKQISMKHEETGYIITPNQNKSIITISMSNQTNISMKHKETGYIRIPNQTNQPT